MNAQTASFISTQIASGEYYYLNLTPDTHAGEVIVCGGREQCASNYRIERKGFRFPTIEFVTAGRGVLVLDDNRYELRSGMLFHYGPRTPHVIETDPTDPLIKHFVSFTGHQLTELLKSTVFGHGIPLHASRPFRIRNIFENLITTGNTQSRNRDALCSLLLRQLILLADDTAMDAHTAASRAWQTYLRCRQHVEQNYLEISTVREVADAGFVNQAYLTRLFKRFAEETPLQLLNRLKMNRAAELLGNRDMLVKEVAEAIGYTDPYHFSRVFKRVYGVPPETFSETTRRHA